MIGVLEFLGETEVSGDTYLNIYHIIYPNVDHISYYIKYNVYVIYIYGVRNGTPLQYSFLENSMDRGDWQATVHRATKSQTLLSN